MMQLFWLKCVTAIHTVCSEHKADKRLSNLTSSFLVFLFVLNFLSIVSRRASSPTGSGDALTNIVNTVVMHVYTVFVM